VLQYGESNPVTKSDIKFHFFDKNDEDLVLYPNKGDEQIGSFSPSGKYFAYRSDEEGRNEIYVQPFPIMGNLRKKVSIEGGHHPVWSPNGDKLYYMYDNTNSIMEVSVQYTNGISFGILVKKMKFYIGFRNWI